MPFLTIILPAGRMAVPQELYEAAAVDGANGLRRFVHVTLPLMARACISSAHCSIPSLPSATSTRRISFRAAGRRCPRRVLATLGIRLWVSSISRQRHRCCDGDERPCRC